VNNSVHGCQNERGEVVHFSHFTHAARLGCEGVTFPFSPASLICRGLTCFCKLDKYRFGNFIFPSTTNLEVYMQPKLSKAMDRQEIERLIEEASRNLHIIDCNLTFFKRGPADSSQQWKRASNSIQDPTPRWILVIFKLKFCWKKRFPLIVTSIV
jgi:hypothetical protein